MPKVVVKKIEKKVSFWKRLIAFCLGVLQVVIGTIILAGTAGAFTGLGTHMIIEGTKDIYNSIFKP